MVPNLPQKDMVNKELYCMYNVRHDRVPEYLNSCDLVLLTSKWEGSPNIVKEAMACCKQVVSIAVGDVEWLLDGLDGCYIAANSSKDIERKTRKALDHSRKGHDTGGRKRIIDLELDELSVSKKLATLYHSIIASYD